MSDPGGATPVFILGGSDRNAVEFAKRHREELGITELGQVVAVRDFHQLRGRHGGTLIVLEDCYHQRPRWYEFISYARMYGMDISYRNCGEALR